MTSPSSRSGDTRIHLRIAGHDRAFALPAPRGCATLADLLPTARALSDQLTDAALVAEAADGRSISCRPGCAACCRQLVPISAIEAQALTRAVDALPRERRDRVRSRFADAIAALERIGLLDPAAPRGRVLLRSELRDVRAAWRDVTHRYFAAQIPCPLLEDERCSFYDARPLVCREYLVTSSPERCATLDEGVRAVPRPVRMSEALAGAVREFTGDRLPLIPLPLALEWSDAAGTVLDDATDGENLFNHLIGAVDELLAHTGAAAPRSSQRPGQT